MGVLRLILALIVVIEHSEPLFGLNFIGGKNAVQAFYVISGFYMALILNEKYIGINNNYKLYLSNRLIKLYPIYWAYLLIIICCSLVVILITKGEKLGMLNAFIENFDQLSFGTLITLIFTNIFIFLQDIMLFFEINNSGSLQFQSNFHESTLPAFKFALIPQAWTVGLEILFYSIAPFIVRRKNILIIGLLIVLTVLNYILKHQFGLNYTPWNSRFFPSELVYFLYGILAYKLFKSAHFKTYLKLKTVIIPLFVFLLFGYDFFNFKFDNHIMISSLILALPIIFHYTRKNKLDRKIGELSYPIYISHYFIISVLSYTKNEMIYNIYTIMTASLIVSFLLQKLIGNKVETYRQNRIKKP